MPSESFVSHYDTEHVKDARAIARTIRLVAGQQGKPEMELLDQLEAQLASVVVQANLRGQMDFADRADRTDDALHTRPHSHRRPRGQ